MTQTELIAILRKRLADVSAQITARLDAKRPTMEQFQTNHGYTSAAMSEQQFLVKLIERLEREGVTK